MQKYKVTTTNSKVVHSQNINKYIVRYINLPLLFGQQKYISLAY